MKSNILFLLLPFFFCLKSNIELSPYNQIIDHNSLLKYLLSFETIDIDKIQKNTPDVSGNTRLGSFPFISGDTFRAFADHIFDETSKSLSPSSIKTRDVIFLKTDYMAEFFRVIHPRIKNEYILITHNSDYGAPEKFSQYLESPKLIHWFGINPTISNHNKFTPIPIGIANARWKHGNPQTFFKALKICNQDNQRSVLVGSNFAITTKTRRPILEMLRLNNYCLDLRSKDHFTYLKNMTKAKFIISPEGNGLDCHRTYEAILMGSIAIVKHSNLDEIFKNLPVLLINNWQEISKEKLNKKYQLFSNRDLEHNKLTFEYWWKLIKSYQK